MAKNYITDCFTKENDGTHFKGIIWASDFYTDYSDKRNIASRIAQDYMFDKSCHRKSKARERRQKHKKGKQE